MTSTNYMARRATVWHARDGWRYKVQGWNWRTIATSGGPNRQRARVLAKVRRDWPGVEIVIVEPARRQPARTAASRPATGPS